MKRKQKPDSKDAYLVNFLRDELGVVGLGSFSKLNADKRLHFFVRGPQFYIVRPGNCEVVQDRKSRLITFRYGDVARNYCFTGNPPYQLRDETNITLSHRENHPEKYVGTFQLKDAYIQSKRDAQEIQKILESKAKEDFLKRDGETFALEDLGEEEIEILLSDPRFSSISDLFATFPHLFNV